MADRLTILYRGPLASCNYHCGYCPLAKRRQTEAELAGDRDALGRFCDWAAGSSSRLALLFTPWGEALVRPWYRDAVAELSWLPHIDRVVVQTNLACRLEWLQRCDRRSLALWCTYHPGQTTREDFLAQCRVLDAMGLRYSAGLVGLREFLPEARALRAELSPRVYLWVNAYKDTPGYYAEDDVRQWEEIDPYFRVNLQRYRSIGRRCRAGANVVSVDGAGVVRRCHFVSRPLGNLYDADFHLAPGSQPCPNETCGCHIGYVHLEDLGLYEVFGDGVLERVPCRPVWSDPAARREARALSRRLAVLECGD